MRPSRRFPLSAAAVAAIVLFVTSFSATTLTPSDAGAAKAVKLPRLKLTRVADLDGTTAMALQPQTGTLFVAQQEGQVWTLRNRELGEEPALDLRRSISSGGERGLLGLA